MYSQQQLDAAVRRQERVMRELRFKPAGKKRDLVPHASIPKELYWNAVKGHGVDPNDTEYWRDMKRLVPCINPQMDRPIRSTLQHLTPVPGAKRRNRFGNVSYHKVFK